MRKLIHLLAILIGSVCVATAAEQKPNIVFILLDDLGWTDLGCYGSKFYQTPTIDRLAGQGMKFTDAYAACPVCSPTRASVLTGKYPARLHLTDFIPGRDPKRDDQKLLRPEFHLQLPLEETTLAEALKPAGYVSGHFGKWHLGREGFEPQKQGFDVSFAGNPKGGSPGSDEPEKGEYDITEATLKFVEDNKDRPFFAYVCYNTPHIPLFARKALVAKYEQRVDPRLPHTNAVYAAMMESVDTQIGRVLKKLADLNLEERTIVIFTSDNGGLHVREWQGTVKATQNTPLRGGKGYLYEGGTRVPLIVRWPGVVQPDTTNSSIVSSVDYFPTLLESVGVKISANPGVDGVSFLPVLTGKGAVKRGAVYWHYPHYSNQGGEPGGSIREGDFKLIQFFEQGRVELYNLREDPGETTNLAPTMKGKVIDLVSKLDLWRRQAKADMMMDNPRWDSSKPRAIPSE